MMQNSPDVERIQTAAHWMARLWSDIPSDQDHDACKAWRDEDPKNEHAWQCLMNAQERFGEVPKEASRIITRSRQLSRRRFLSLTGFATGGFLASTMYQNEGNYNQLLANFMGTSAFTTATGEIKSVVLADSSQLTINTATVMAMPTANTLALDYGEFLLDSPGSQPYHVKTPNGLIRLDKGQLHVRHTSKYTRVSLYRGQPAHVTGHDMQATTILNPGNSLAFNTSETQSIQKVNPDAISWVIGKLVVNRMPLTDFIEELSRYRKGVLRVSPALNHLAVTGVFTLKDTDRILQQLRASLPIKLNRLTRYWVTISAV
ncbi:MAG: hypothetical protein COB23_06850 [Methylophaga sp.]|nr:MAG: hypothetical protein COB23_06850 [Methylophaga sp.]